MQFKFKKPASFITLKIIFGNFMPLFQFFQREGGRSCPEINFGGMLTLKVIGLDIGRNVLGRDVNLVRKTL